MIWIQPGDPVERLFAVFLPRFYLDTEGEFSFSVVV